jgi:hypothetical protein
VIVRSFLCQADLFTFGMALEIFGDERVSRHVGVEPSGDAFNAIELHATTNRPYNPMINSGAITGGLSGHLSPVRSDAITFATRPFVPGGTVDFTTTNVTASSASDYTATNGTLSFAPGETSKTFTVPAGTIVSVRLGETLGSKVSQSGQNFDATLAEPLVVEEKEVIPAGAGAHGVVVDAKPLGRFKGAASLQIALTSIKDYNVQTASVNRSAKGKGKRTAVMIGGGAGAGALIGALAGGGKGAAIGALVGGGAGTAGAAFTGNKDIVLPAETVVSFKLLQPIEVKI